MKQPEQPSPQTQQKPQPEQRSKQPRRCRRSRRPPRTPTKQPAQRPQQPGRPSLQTLRKPQPGRGRQPPGRRSTPSLRNPRPAAGAPRRPPARRRPEPPRPARRRPDACGETIMALLIRIHAGRAGGGRPATPTSSSADREIFWNNPLDEGPEIWDTEVADTQTPPRGSGEGGGHHGIATRAGHHRTGAGAPRPDEDPMLVEEAGEGSRRSRGEVRDFRVLRVAGGFERRVTRGVRSSGGQRGPLIIGPSCTPTCGVEAPAGSGGSGVSRSVRRS